MNNDKKLKTVFFDFDGVLSTDYFYKTLDEVDPILYEFINEKIFKEDKPLVRKWMRGEINSNTINRIMSKRFNKPQDIFNDHLIKGIKEMKLNEPLLEYIQIIREKGVKVAILTDNMDVFTKYLVPCHDLKSKFDRIFSSFEFEGLKLDNEGDFIKDSMKQMNSEYNETLIVDDWIDIGIFFKNYGGHFFHYRNNFQEFITWFEENFLV